MAIPLGILSGRLPRVRHVSQPYLNFFRFIPPLALIGLAIVWFGIGEASKIASVVNTAVFTVFLGTLAGAAAVDEVKINAARCLGASQRQVLWHVVVPATVPAMITSARIAMGFSFMAVVAAELIAAETGIGVLIYNSWLYLQTQNAFAGIVVLGLMGMAADMCFRVVVLKPANRHGIKL